MRAISLISRDFATQDEVQGFYHPADGVGQGTWFGDIFGLVSGGMGYFILPEVGPLTVIGPLSGMIAGAIEGAGPSALVNGLVTAGIPHDQALKYQERILAGDFMVVLYGGAEETSRAHETLENTAQTHLWAHGFVSGGPPKASAWPA
jgi:hypothetical protein